MPSDTPSPIQNPVQDIVLSGAGLSGVLPAPALPNGCSCSALRRATRHMTRIYDAALAPAGIGVNQYSILTRLDRDGALALNALAALLVMDRSSLGHLLRPLEERGLLALDVDPEDRRRRRITLTPAGRRTVADARPLWAAAERRFREEFGEDAAADLRQTLHRVTTSLPLPA